MEPNKKDPKDCNKNNYSNVTNIFNKVCQWMNSKMESKYFNLLIPYNWPHFMFRQIS